MEQKNSDLYKIYGSEEYARRLEVEEISWHERFDGLIAKKISLFDRLISLHTAEAYDMLVKLIDDEMTVEVQVRNTDYAWMVIFAQIYLAEKQAGEKVHFYDFADSLKQLIGVIQQLKFYIWELEFLNEDEAGQELLDLAGDGTLSNTMLDCLIMIASVDKTRIKDYFRQRLNAER